CVEPVGSLTSGSEAFGAAAAGMTDGYAGWATVYGGEMPEGMLAYGLAMGASSPEEAWDAMWGNTDYRIGERFHDDDKVRTVHWYVWMDLRCNDMVFVISRVLLAAQR